MSERNKQPELQSKENVSTSKEWLSVIGGIAVKPIIYGLAVAGAIQLTGEVVTHSLPPESNESTQSTPENECMEMPLDTSIIEDRTAHIVDEAIDETIQETPEDFIQSSRDIYIDDNVAESLDITPYDPELFFDFKEATTVDAAAEILTEYANTHHGITLRFGNDAVQDSPHYHITPYEPVEHLGQAALNDLRRSLAYLPETLTRDLDLNSFEVRIVGSITPKDEEAHEEAYAGLASYDKETDSAIITLTADALILHDSDKISATWMHEMGHIIDEKLECNKKDPQLDELTPDWLTEEAREDLYESGVALPRFVTGGAYGVKNQNEEKAGVYSAILGAQEIEEIIYPTIEDKVALAWVRINEMSPDTAVWLWFSMHYSDDDVNELVLGNSTWIDEYPGVN